MGHDNTNNLVVLEETTLKKKYQSPTIICIVSELENGIATTSTQIQFGGSTGTPEVTDWEEKKNEQFWDF